MTYNGHRNYNFWNVALWIGNDEGLYRLALDYKRQLGSKRGAAAFVETMIEYANMNATINGQPSHDKTGRPCTPDGAPWTISAVRAALGGLE